MKDDIKITTKEPKVDTPERELGNKYGRYNPHGSGCKGHAIYMLDGDPSDTEYKKTMLLVLDNAIASYDLP